MITLVYLYFAQNIWTYGKLVPQVNFLIISIILYLTFMVSFA